jgi:hypothetical protein
VIGERVTSEGEQDVVAPPGIVCRGEVQCDRDERTDVLYADGLDMDVGDDGGLIVVIRRSSATGRGRGRRRRKRLDQGHRDVGLLGEDGSRALLLFEDGLEARSDRTGQRRKGNLKILNVPPGWHL